MIWTIIFRTVLFYFLVVIAYKIMGKREVGELGVFDFIISMLISQLIAICIENYKDPIWFVIVPTLILVLFQIVFSFLSLKSNKFRDILDGKESVIISNGKLNFSEMKKQKYNLNDLLLQLRDKGIRTIEEVDYAILETNGKLSVFQKQDDNNNVFPLPLVLDGVIEENNLKFINKTRKWLNNELSKKKINLDNIFYAFYKDDEIYVIENEN
ncbi:uncharacterized conserved membrane protein [Clostridium sp. CAG:433]|jgi:uncharacterized membrane protein YcaP (DUF421 family)|nr:uncharacterized conserved membrane protein [Clostridium sp. CAG:433]